MCSRFCLGKIWLVNKLIPRAERSTVGGIGARLGGHSLPLALTRAPVVDVHVCLWTVDECSFSQHHIARVLLASGRVVWRCGVGQFLLSRRQLGGSLWQLLWPDHLSFRHYLQKSWSHLLKTQFCCYWEVLWGEHRNTPLLKKSWLNWWFYFIFNVSTHLFASFTHLWPFISTRYPWRTLSRLGTGGQKYRLSLLEIHTKVNFHLQRLCIWILKSKNYNGTFMVCTV